MTAGSRLIAAAMLVSGPSAISVTGSAELPISSTITSTADPRASRREVSGRCQPSRPVTPARPSDP